MILSKQFLQNMKIFVLAKSDRTDIRTISIIYHKGLFIPCLTTLGTPVGKILPCMGKENVLQYIAGIQGYSALFQNGFKVSDVEHLATTEQAKAAFGFANSTNWYENLVDKSELDSLTGYIEPEPSVTNLENPLVLSLTAHCKKLQDILTANGLQVPAYQSI
jgi:hypothetical protein